MKKLFLMFIFALLSFGVSANAATLSVTDGGGINGDILILNVQLEGSGVVGGQLDITYDGNILSHMEDSPVVDEKIESSAFVNDTQENKITLTWLNKKEIADGNLCELVFRINTAESLITYIDIENAMLSNFDAMEIPCTTKPGRIAINCFDVENVFMQNNTKLTDTFNTGTITYKTILKNYTNSKVNADVYVAVYTGDKLSALKKTGHSLLTQGTKETQNETLNIGNDVTKIKAFVWDNNLTPLRLPDILERSTK